MLSAERTKQRDFFVAAYERASISFDKAVMTLSGGALAISITFVDDLAPTPERKPLLGASWAAFAASLLVILISFLLSQHALIDTIRQIDDEKSEITPGWTAKATKWFNLTAAGLFVLGVVFLVVFALYNL